MNLHSLGLALGCAVGAWCLSHFTHEEAPTPSAGIPLLSPPKQQGQRLRVTGKVTKVERKLDGRAVIRLHTDDGADLMAVLNPSPFAGNHDHARPGARLALHGFHISPGLIALDPKEPWQTLPDLVERVDLYGHVLHATRTANTGRGAQLRLQNGSIVRLAFPLHVEHLSFRVKPGTWTHVLGFYANDQRTFMVEELQQQ